MNLVERLRHLLTLAEFGGRIALHKEQVDQRREAADRIEELEQEVISLRVRMSTMVPDHAHHDAVTGAVHEEYIAGQRMLEATREDHRKELEVLRDTLERVRSASRDLREADAFFLRKAQDEKTALSEELAALRAQEPVAFLCLLANEDGEILLRRFRNADKTFAEGWTVFGLPGRDYSEEFYYTEHPLYAAHGPAAPAVPDGWHPMRWRQMDDPPKKTGRYIVAHAGMVGGSAFYTAAHGDTHYPAGWAQVPQCRPTHWLEFDRAAMLAAAQEGKP